MLDELDAIDRRLLELLQTGGRMSNADLARTVRMAPSAVFERVRRLERDGVIRGYGARLDPRALERSLLAFVLVRTDEKMQYHLQPEAAKRLFSPPRAEARSEPAQKK